MRWKVQVLLEKKVLIPNVDGDRFELAGAEGRRRGSVPRATAHLGGRSNAWNKSIYGIYVMLSGIYVKLLVSMRTENYLDTSTSCVDVAGAQSIPSFHFQILLTFTVTQTLKQFLEPLIKNIYSPWSPPFPRNTYKLLAFTSSSLDNDVQCTPGEPHILFLLIPLNLSTQDSSMASSPSIPPQGPRFRPYASPNHQVTKGRYITSNDPRGYM